MIIYCICLLIVPCITTAVSSEFSLKGDPCSKFDSCYSKPLLRTCSCESGCQVYGTCCHDMQKDAHPNDGKFQCHYGRTTAPVFAKRSCLEDFKGHIGDIAACFDDEIDEMDVKNNLLVTSHKTKTTYWNKNCAVCNNESKEDLEFWNIEVFCPRHDAVNRNLIRRNLTFDQDNRQWGLQVGDEFLQCIVKFAPPSYIDEVPHCTPNIISSCPADYTEKDIVSKCSQYYAERKLKNTDTYYKNIHCAICNGVNVKELECPGMFVPENIVDESDFQDMVEETFVKGFWLTKEPGKFFECSRGFNYDPFQARCRRDRTLDAMYTNENNSSNCMKKGSLALLVFLFVFIFL